MNDSCTVSVIHDNVLAYMYMLLIIILWVLCNNVYVNNVGLCLVL